jgi:polysaccharide chain length determinant protein (PEP-CTERM system associated)
VEALSLLKNSPKNFYDYLEILLRRKWILIAPIAAGAVIAGVVALNMDSYYRSSTMILIEEQQVSESYVEPTDRTPIGSRLNTLSQQIMSRTRLEKIAADHNLYQDNNPGLFSRLLLRVGLKDASSSTVSKESIVRMMRRDIVVKILNKKRSGSGGEAFSISYVGTDPYTTQQVTGTIASLFIEENLKVREQYAEGTTEFLQGELNKAKGELEVQENALRRFKERHMGSLPGQLEANLRTLDRLQLKLQNLQEVLQNNNNQLALYERQLDLTPGKSKSSIGMPLEEELHKLELELQNLLSVYTESYPDVIFTRNRIEEISSQLADESYYTNSIDEEYDAELDSLDGADLSIMVELSSLKSKISNNIRREDEARVEIKKYEQRVEETPANEQKMADIRRDYDISLQNYRSLLEKKLNARLAANLEKMQKGARFRVIDPANLPELPYKPNKMRVLVMGILAGSGLGCGLIFLLEFLNPAFRKPEDFNGVLNLPVLTTISDFRITSAAPQIRRLKVIRNRKRVNTE